MKPEKDPCSSRREFLKKTIKATGYAVPAIMVFKMGSSKAWAQKYEARTDAGSRQDVGSTRNAGSSDPCKGVFEKIFKSSCWK